jgi:hypothetical protein
MEDLLHRVRGEKRRSKRRWRMLGLLLVGLALVVYWFDRWQTGQTAQGVSAAPPSSADQSTGIGLAAAPRPAPSSPAAEPERTAPKPEDAPAAAVSAEDERADEGGAIVEPASEQDAVNLAEATETPPDTIPSVPGAEEAAGLDASTGWVDGDGTRDCPEGYPIKGNANSRIYHLPGESSYDVTIPEICFATEDDAATAGYRPRRR